VEQAAAASAPKIPWHPAFVQAIQLELEQYRAALNRTPVEDMTVSIIELNLTHKYE
jgi:hypothetical protein